jgi:hypothetical protein
MSFSTARTLLTSAARTASGVGPAVDCSGDASADLLLDVTALSGAPCFLTATLETSRDGLIGWTEVTPLDALGASASWPRAGVVSPSWVVFGALSRYVRARWRIALIATTLLASLTYGVGGSLDGLTISATVDDSGVSVTFAAPADANAVAAQVTAQADGDVTAEVVGDRLVLTGATGDGVLVLTGGTALATLGLTLTLPSATFSVSGTSVQTYADLADLDAFGLPAGALTGRSTEQIIRAIRGTSDIMSGILANRGFDLPATAWHDDLRECNAVGAAWTGLGVRGTTPILENGDHADDPLLSRYRWFFGRDGTDKSGWIWESVPLGFIDATPDDITGEGGSHMVTDARRGW